MSYVPDGMVLKGFTAGLDRPPKQISLSIIVGTDSLVSMHCEMVLLEGEGLASTDVGPLVRAAALAAREAVEAKFCEMHPSDQP